MFVINFATLIQDRKDFFYVFAIKCNYEIYRIRENSSNSFEYTTLFDKHLLITIFYHNFTFFPLYFFCGITVDRKTSGRCCYFCVFENCNHLQIFFSSFPFMLWCLLMVLMKISNYFDIKFIKCKQDDFRLVGYFRCAKWKQRPGGDFEF